MAWCASCCAAASCLIISTGWVGGREDPVWDEVCALGSDGAAAALCALGADGAAAAALVRRDVAAVGGGRGVAVGWAAGVLTLHCALVSAARWLQ